MCVVVYGQSVLAFQRCGEETEETSFAEMADTKEGQFSYSEAQ